MFGKHVHEAVRANKDTISGITIHFVNEVYDDGEVILQATCRLEPSDSPLLIARKVQELEHRYFPIAVDGVWSQISKPD